MPALVPAHGPRASGEQTPAFRGEGPHAALPFGLRPVSLVGAPAALRAPVGIGGPRERRAITPPVQTSGRRSGADSDEDTPHPGPSASPTCTSHTRSNHLHPRRQAHRFLPELASSLDRFPSQGFVPETQLLQPMTPLNRTPQSSPSRAVPFRALQRDSSLGDEGQTTGLLHLAS